MFDPKTLYRASLNKTIVIATSRQQKFHRSVIQVDNPGTL